MALLAAAKSSAPGAVMVPSKSKTTASIPAAGGLLILQIVNQKCRSISEQIKNVAKNARISGEKFGITTMLASDGFEFAALDIKNLAPEAAGTPQFAGFKTAPLAFQASVLVSIHSFHAFLV